MFGLQNLEHRRLALATQRKFALRMAIAIAMRFALAAFGLAIGMAGYAGFEGMSLTDAYVNAAMILSGMGPVSELKTTAGKDLRRVLRDLLGTDHRDRLELRARPDLSSRAASIPCRAGQGGVTGATRQQNA